MLSRCGLEEMGEEGGESANHKGTKKSKEGEDSETSHVASERLHKEEQNRFLSVSVETVVSAETDFVEEDFYEGGYDDGDQG